MSSPISKLNVYDHIEGSVLDRKCYGFLGTSHGGRMSRASASCSGRSGKLNVTGSNLELAFSNPGRVKPMTVKLIIVPS